MRLFPPMANPQEYPPTQQRIIPYPIYNPPSRLRKKSEFVIARSEATKQSGVSDEKNEIASLPPVARNDIYLFFPQPFKKMQSSVRPAAVKFLRARGQYLSAPKYPVPAAGYRRLETSLA
jgi:hypothetical protein